MKKRPNVLLLVTDQHNYKVCGFMGDEKACTPNIDKIASDGIVFERSYCQSPVCTASRASFLTGKYVSGIGCWNNHWPIFPEHKTIAHLMADSGYETCLVGKMHFGGKDQYQGFMHRPYGDLKHGLGHQSDPIDFFPTFPGVREAGISEIPESMQQETVVAVESAAFVENHVSNNPEKPWFLCSSFTKPHAPFAVPARYFNKYNGKIKSPGLKESDQAASHPYIRNEVVNYGLDEVTKEQEDRAVAAYYACMEYVDDCIGLLLWRLEKAGQLDNTIIIYTTDHGEMLSNHGLWGKANYYEESLRVPFVMSGPDIPKGIRSDELVGLIDLLPTICDYTEVNTPNKIDGMSLRPVIENIIESGGFRDYIISEYYGMASLTGPYITGKKGDSMRALCTRNGKYVNVHKYDNLYFDHLTDPDEIKNKINNPVFKDEIARLSNILDTSFSWEKTIESINRDRQRYNENFRSGLRTSTPNQYVLEDGRMFDAEASLYSVRWNPVDVRKGFIPQRYF